MFLANPAEIREALGFDEMTDISEAINGSLNATTPILASKLGSSFDEGEFTDRYYVPQVGFRQGSSVQTEFRLSRGFVREIKSATYADNMSAIGLRTPDILSSLMQDDKDKIIGRVRDYSTPYAAAYMQITYTAGFAKKDANTYDLDMVPDWLQEAAKIRALIGLSGSPSFKQAEIVLDTKTMENELAALLNPFKRYIPLGLFPL